MERTTDKQVLTAAVLCHREIGDAPRRLLQRLVLGVADDADDLEIAAALAPADAYTASDRILIGEEPARQRLVDDDDPWRSAQNLLGRKSLPRIIRVPSVEKYPGDDALK